MLFLHSAATGRETSMKTVFSTFAALLLLMNIFEIGAQAQAAFRKISFEKACVLARSSKKPIMIDFYTEWCGPCKRLDQTTWKDEKVKTWLSGRLVSLKVDAEKNAKLASKYKINAYPTILFVKPDGSEIDRIVGYLEPKEFLSSAKDALAGRDALSRAKDKLVGANKNDPGKRLAYAQALQGKERYREALGEYLWCFDTGMKTDPAYFGVRASFLLSYIADLGSRYPLAIAALKERRDKAELNLDKKPLNLSDAVEFIAINRVLEDAELSLKVYLEKSDKSSDFASQVFNSISSTLIAYKRYDDYVKFGGKLVAKVETDFAQSRQFGDIYSDRELQGTLKKIEIEKAGYTFEAYCGVKNEAEATKILSLILDFDKSEKTFETLLQNAKRAENPAMAENILVSAEKTLKPKEFEDLKRSANSH